MFDEPTAYQTAPNAIIEIDGEETVDFADQFVSVEVDTSRNRPAMCRVVFATTRDDEGGWIVVDSDMVRPWKTLVVKAVLDGEEIEIFSGYIVKVAVSFTEDEPQVEITGQDKTILMDREHKNRVWGAEDGPVTDGDIVGELVAEYSLTATTEPGLSRGPLNQDETDIRLINRLARANGFEVSVKEDELYFGPPRVDEDEQPEIRIYCGETTNCSDFTVVDDGYKPDVVMVDVYRDRDYERQELGPALTRLGSEDADADSIQLGDFKWKVRLPGVDAEEVVAAAQARADEHAWKIKATGSLDGLAYGHVLESGKPVPVQGVGELHSGTYYVDSVTHRIDMNGYRQDFVLLRNARGS